MIFALGLAGIVAIASINSTVVGFLIIGNTTVFRKLQLVVRALFMFRKTQRYLRNNIINNTKQKPTNYYTYIGFSGGNGQRAVKRKRKTKNTVLISHIIVILFLMRMLCKHWLTGAGTIYLVYFLIWRQYHEWPIVRSSLQQKTKTNLYPLVRVLYATATHNTLIQ